MNTARTGPPSMPGNCEVLLEGVQLAAEGVALGDDVHQPEVLAVEHDQPGAGAEDRAARRVERAQRLGEALAGDAERHRRRLAAGHARARRGPSRSAGRADLADVGAERRQDARVRAEAALQREDADERPVAGVRGARRARYQPRPASSCGLVELARLEALHRDAEALGGLGHARGVAEVGRRLDDRRPRAAPGRRT